MTDKYVEICPYCGGTEIITAYQTYHGELISTESAWLGCDLYHSICRKCGSVLRSYVKDPEQLVKKQNRKQK